MGRWQARTLRRATRTDGVFLVTLLVLAGGTLFAGRVASKHLSPDGAAQVVKTLADLELPGRLPNATLLDEEGGRSGLLSRMKRPKAVVGFYAPWCGPCQKELPELYKEVEEDRADLFIVVSKNEDRVDTRRKFDNLGLEDREFLVDENDRLMKAARVASLPTTFVINKYGKVLGRTKGYSDMGLWRLMNKANLGTGSTQVPEPLERGPDPTPPTTADAGQHEETPPREAE